MPPHKKKPIGVFDSGIGGLTVLKEVARLLPGEDTVYLGDTARVPYGSKSRETIRRYSLEIAEFLIRNDGIKLLIIACNTASAYALPMLKKRLQIPVVGVIEPGAESAARATRTRKVGIIGTEGTIKSSAYKDAIRRIDPRIRTYALACPMFVPLVEEGWTDDKITKLVVERYLGPMKTRGIDSLVLGCTHYPLLKKCIARFMGADCLLIDSATATAVKVRGLLKGLGLADDSKKRAFHKFYATDSPERFVAVGRRFLGARLVRAHLTRLSP
jgi:glutamate racemase